MLILKIPAASCRESPKCKEVFIVIRSLTPQQATGNALAVHFQYTQKEGHAQVLTQRKCDMERKMAEKGVKRFGVIAVEKGFITLEQLVEALTVQVIEETEGKKRRLIGQILLSLGYLTSPQIDEVMESLDAQ